MPFLGAADIEGHTWLGGHCDVAGATSIYCMQLEEEVLLCLDRIPVHMSAMTDTAAFTRVLKSYLFSGD